MTQNSAYFEFVPLEMQAPTGGIILIFTNKLHISHQLILPLHKLLWNDSQFLPNFLLQQHNVADQRRTEGRENRILH